MHTYPLMASIGLSVIALAGCASQDSGTSTSEGSRIAEYNQSRETHFVQDVDAAWECIERIDRSRVDQALATHHRDDVAEMYASYFNVCTMSANIHPDSIPTASSVAMNACYEAQICTREEADAYLERFNRQTTIPSPSASPSELPLSHSQWYAELP